MGFGQAWSAEDKLCIVIATEIGCGQTGCCCGYRGRLRTTKVAFCGHWCSLRTHRVFLPLQGLTKAHKGVVVG